MGSKPPMCRPLLHGAPGPSEGRGEGREQEAQCRHLGAGGWRDSGVVGGVPARQDSWAPATGRAWWQGTLQDGTWRASPPLPQRSALSRRRLSEVATFSVLSGF